MWRGSEGRDSNIWKNSLAEIWRGNEKDQNSGKEADWFIGPAVVRARDSKGRALTKWTNGGRDKLGLWD